MSQLNGGNSKCFVRKGNPPGIYKVKYSLPPDEGRGKGKNKIKGFDKGEDSQKQELPYNGIGQRKKIKKKMFKLKRKMRGVRI